jgi:hypothetical protein
VSSGIFQDVPGVGRGERGTCRGCQAEIWWAKHPTSGRAHPFNADGVSHFATCPNAGEFRGERRKRQGLAPIRGRAVR